MAVLLAFTLELFTVTDDETSVVGESKLDDICESIYSNTYCMYYLSKRTKYATNAQRWA
jgi:hypothetical protein